jgi:hypothetical protein
MKFRKVSLAVATFAMLVPALSQAGSERDGFNACASAFASTLTSPGAAVPAFKADYLPGRSTGSMLDFFTHEYSFDLRADDPKTGAIVARARCTTDTRGTVRGLAPLPLNVGRAGGILGAGV